MRNILVAVAAAGMICFATSANAQEAAASAAVAAPAPAVTQSAPVYRNSRTVRRNRRSGNFFSDLMELERRKNAWLMRTFLGR